MADYVAQTDSQLDPDAPLTSELAYGWRDNLIAVTEGAPGAPRVDGNAFPDHLAGAVVLDAVTHSGLDILTGSNAGGGGAGTNFQYYWSFTAIKAAALRMQADMKVSIGSATARIAIIRNGTVVTEVTTSSISYAAQQIDFTYGAGDQITVRAGINYTNAGEDSFIRNLTILSDRRGTYRT